MLRLLEWVLIILIVIVTVQIVASYVDYFPPNFESDFLLSREGHFHGVYRVAFYIHICSSPTALLTGLWLQRRAWRKRYPNMHRRLGRFQGALVLLGVVPSGLCMSYRALTGVVAGTGFALLSIATAISAAYGWRRARQHRFTAHYHWMTRCTFLLTSAIVLRIMSGVATFAKFDSPSIYSASAWASWLGPLIACEVFLRSRRVHWSVRDELSESLVPGETDVRSVVAAISSDRNSTVESAHRTCRPPR